MKKSLSLSLACLVGLVLVQQSAFAYQLDAGARSIGISPGSTPSATTTDLRNALNYLATLKDKSRVWTVNMAPGKYFVTNQLTVRNLQNVNFLSNLNSPAQLIKNPGWNSATGGEYLMHITYSKNVSVAGMQFYGTTNYTKNSDPVWSDQGIYFGSCDTVVIKNNGFFNFGNSALRVATHERDPIRGVNSRNTQVLNNLFNNIYQLSTTTTDTLHGGTQNFLLQSNVFYNLRGSIKFASRTAGAKDIKILNNRINGGSHYGLELNNYNNVEIRGNQLQNIQEFAMNIYNNTNATGSFNWGENYTVADNVITNAGKGLRFSTEPYANGVKVNARNVKFDNNTFNGITNTSGNPAIAQVNGNIAGLTITRNKLSNIANKKYIGYTSGSTNVVYNNNQVNGSAFGPQQSTASK
ncbi:hypothetical protein [Vampirovibrio sp.]|uniref:hypothetical protein n=1 Tax=Vampirovibrio sp. TaxID=2717857 RepID=UPI0035937E64